MTILKDVYALYEKENSKFAKRRAFQNVVAIELSENLDFMKEALDEKIDCKSIASQLEDKEYRKAISDGFDLNSLKNGPLNSLIYGNIKEFEKYKDWDTEKLIINAYKRISTMKKIILADNSIDITKRLQSLFKYVLLIFAHLTDSKINRNT